MKKILVYPYYNSPYQSLLYNEVQKNPDITIKYLRSKYGGSLLLLDLPLRIIKNRMLGFAIFHLHWVAFTSASKNKITQLFSFIYTLCIIGFIKLLGYKLVWTIHNIVPHETITANDLFITKLLCKISDRKIVHSQSTINELEKLGCSVQNITIVPHGNYVSYYKDTVTKKDARDFLKIKQNTFVFLFFGELKRYKGIEELLEVFTHISASHKNILLLISGKVCDKEIYSVISSHKSSLKNTALFYIRHIEDDEVQYFMHAADIVVYAFKKITTSGSVLLALSFGKPIIYPLMGSLEDLPENIGFSYIPSDKNGLYNAMTTALTTSQEKLTERKKNAYKYVQSLSWEKIAEQTITIYKNV
jgi:glycosyltransferase involved in cell wall biosynthesis